MNNKTPDDICANCGHDELEKQIDWGNLMKMPRYAGGHDEQMKGLIKNAEVIGHWNEGDYQGEVATCLKVPCGKFIIYNDYYGSCSGCDAWEDASDEDVKKMLHDLVYSCKIFNTLEEVYLFLSQKDFDDYSWKNCSKELLDEIKKFIPKNQSQNTDDANIHSQDNILQEKSLGMVKAHNLETASNEVGNSSEQTKPYTTAEVGIRSESRHQGSYKENNACISDKDKTAPVDFEDEIKKEVLSKARKGHAWTWKDNIDLIPLSDLDILIPIAIHLTSEKMNAEWKKKIEEARIELMKAKQFNNSHDAGHLDRIHYSIVDKILKNILDEGENQEKK